MTRNMFIFHLRAEGVDNYGGKTGEWEEAEKVKSVTRTQVA